jgi:hypothetical protein
MPLCEAAIRGVSRHEYDMAVALQDWVEKGVPPGSLIATRFVETAKGDREIAFQRPICVYPKVAQYKGGPAACCRRFCVRGAQVAIARPRSLRALPVELLE